MSIRIKNNMSIDLDKIPSMKYESFFEYVLQALSQRPAVHCVSYSAVEMNSKLVFYMLLADDEQQDIEVLSHAHSTADRIELDSLSAKFFALHIFEREIAENFGVTFFNHPWPKPVRWPENRRDKSLIPNNYPFFTIEGNKSHEVGVGPIHAGIIEPGHFRFSCLGEEVKHLEIHLGYQHRGVEKLYLEKKKLLQRTVLSESIAGDMVVGHTLPFVQLMETLYEQRISERGMVLRALALELERIAVHVGDLSAMCTDIAYQLGSSVFGALRTPIINFFQLWCGNRFAKGLLRTGYTPHPLTDELAERLSTMLHEFNARYEDMADKTFSLASVTNRFEKTGHITPEEAEIIGVTGMIARTCGIKRDVRKSHPVGVYQTMPIQTHVLKSGDVYARGKIRDLEIRSSMHYIHLLLEFLKKLPQDAPTAPDLKGKGMQKNKLCIALAEAWRGATLHIAITNDSGELHHYKVVDPSMHNWLALALAMRNNEISDFPINNKSFNLSYCGHDL